MSGRAASPSPPDLRGSLDSIEPDGRVFGWCWSPDEPGQRRRVTIKVDGEDSGSATADVLRLDLLEAGIGDGGHGFVAEIPARLRRPGQEAVIRMDDAASRQGVGGALRVVWPEPAAAPPERLAGNLDLVTRDGWVSGWCWDPADPGRRLTLDVRLDDEVVGSVEAAEPRADLHNAGVGDGRYGFHFMLPYDTLAERGTVAIRLTEQATGRPLGERLLARIGRRAETDGRLQELERQVTLLQGRLDAALRAAEPHGQAQAAHRLFASMAGLFQDLANGVPAEALAGGPRGGVAASLAELRRDLPPLALRPAAGGRDGRPVATLAVPASAPVEQVHACLAALRASDTDLLADIVLLDPAGADARCALLPALVANLRVGPSAATAVGAFARLLAEADTRYVGLLAPQMRPGHGWLAALSATLDEDAGAGLVGAVIGRADGLLHHAGGMFDEAGALRDLGRLAPPELPEHRFLRPVHAVEPLALLIRAGAGELDDAYAAFGPAIADLGLAMQARGFAVLRQPAAFAVCHSEPQPAAEGAAEDGVRLRLAILRHGHAAVFVGRALVVDAELPAPDRDAGSVSAMEQMLSLRRLGWRVTFAAATSGTVAPARDRARLERAGIEVAETSQAGVADLLRDIGGELGLVHLYRHRIARLLLPRVRELAPQARVVFSPADLHFLREARQAALAGVAADAATRDAELACIRAADATLLMSDHERALLAAETEPAHLHLLRWIGRPAADIAGFSSRDGLLFVGNFRHPPNVDAVLWYAREILPILRSLRPGLVLHLAGAAVPPPVAALDGEAIRVHGWVEDLSPLLARTRLSLAPLRYGAGFKGKVATSLAAGLPVVGTSVAFEGTGLGPGDGIAVADAPIAFARAIATLHDDAAAWNELSARARERVAALYSPAAADRIFSGLLAGLGLPTRTPPHSEP